MGLQVQRGIEDEALGGIRLYNHFVGENGHSLFTEYIKGVMAQYMEWFKH